MYSGTTFNAMSGNLVGAHQKLDRVAHRHLRHLMPGVKFPSLRQVLHFEGNNGPDGIKRKSPAQDEPWHYFQPFDPTDTDLLHQIEDHYRWLVAALRHSDMVRAGFEAAWLAHAAIDGLTPAHQFPYEEKLVELRGGQSIDSRDSVKSKLVLPGDTRLQKAANNWKYWGPKGLFTTHWVFEWGVSSLILPMRLRGARPTAADLEKLQKMGLGAWYREQAQTVAGFKIYDDFHKRGWTTGLGRRVRRKLAPLLAQSVILIWWAAASEAALAAKAKP